MGIMSRRRIIEKKKLADAKAKQEPEKVEPAPAPAPAVESAPAPSNGRVKTKADVQRKIEKVPASLLKEN